MGKEINKISTTRFYSPWQSSDTETTKNNSSFGLIETSMMDENMKSKIQAIEKEQLARIERMTEVDDDSSSLLKLAKNLDIHTSSLSHNANYTQIRISQEDQNSIDSFSTPIDLQTPLITLEEFLAQRGSLPQDTTMEQLLPSNDPQVRKVYSKIGEHLAKYQSGKMPKPIKIIPSLPNWDDLLSLTRPSLWTPQATFELTKLFLTIVRAKQTKQFLQYVLLPNVRSSLARDNLLQTPLCLSLQKAATKCPAFFVKGILLPLCESNSCTVLEATTIATSMIKCHLPTLHAATALLRLAELPFSIATSILIQVLIEKRLPLPCRVVDALVVKYFCAHQALGTTRVLPHIWFHTLFIFIKNYGIDLVPTQERKLMELIQSVKAHDLSQLIQNSITIKTSDTEEDSSDDTQSLEEMCEEE